MTQTTKDEAERIAPSRDAIYAAWDHVTMALADGDERELVKLLSAAYAVDFPAALRAARAEALEEAESALDDTHIPSAVYEGIEDYRNNPSVIAWKQGYAAALEEAAKTVDLWRNDLILPAVAFAIRAIAKKDAPHD